MQRQFIENYVQFRNDGSTVLIVCGLFNKSKLSESGQEELKKKVYGLYQSIIFYGIDKLRDKQLAISRMAVVAGFFYVNRC